MNIVMESVIATHGEREDIILRMVPYTLLG
jgi:hypothetical protein